MLGNVLLRDLGTEDVHVLPVYARLGFTELKQLIVASVQGSMAAAHTGRAIPQISAWYLRTSLIVCSCLNTEQLSFGFHLGVSLELGGLV